MSRWFITYVLPLAAAVALAVLILAGLTTGAVLLTMAMML